MAAFLNTDGGSIPLHTELASAKEGGPHTDAAISHRFSPYDFNGGTVVAIAGEDFAVIGSDVRLTRGYSILSRNVTKLCQLTPQCVLGSGGCFTDIKTLQKTLQTRVEMFKHNHGEDMSTPAFAQLLSNTLYYKRFFPYYAFNLVAGLDSEGKGAVYNYDAVGSYQRQVDGYSANGSAVKLIMPLLDNMIGWKNRADEKQTVTAEVAVELLKEAFVTAGERDITCGDAVEIVLIRADGMEKEIFPLKAD